MCSRGDVDHLIEDAGKEYDPDAAPNRARYLALKRLPPCPACGSKKVGFRSPDSMTDVRCLDCGAEFEA